MEAEQLTELAFTNYLLSKLREPLGVCCEMYVKWWLAGASNGAAYLCADGSIAEVSFYSSKQERGHKPLSPAHQSISIRGVTLQVFAPKRLNLEAIIDAAHREVDALQRDAVLLERVVRLQCCAMYDEASDRLARIRQALQELFPGEYAMHQPFEGNADIDILLDRSLMASEVSERFGAIWPEAQEGSPLGYGLTCLAQEQCSDPAFDSCFLHVTARQF